MSKIRRTAWRALVVLCCAGSMGAAQADSPGDITAPAVLTNAAQLRALPRVLATNRLPVSVRGVVTALNPRVTVFLQDATGGTFITSLPPKSRSAFQIGDEVLAEGLTHPGLYLPGIRPTNLTRLGTAELPAPRPVSFDDLLSGRFHYERVEVSGVIRSTRWQASRDSEFWTLAMGPHELEVEIVIPGVTNPLANASFKVDARVRIAGLAGGYINSRHQLLSPQLLVSRVEDIVVEDLSPEDPFATPIVAAIELLNFVPDGSAEHRVRVRGVVTYHRPGDLLCLHDGSAGLFISTRQGANARIGDIVEAVGFPVMRQSGVILENADFRVKGRQTPPPPLEISAEQAMQGTNDASLIRVRGRMLEMLQQEKAAMLVIASDRTVFRALLHGKPKPLPAGSEVALTGVCRVLEVGAETSPRFRSYPLGLELLLRSPDDIDLISTPSPWTAARLATVAGILLAVSLAAFTWVLLLRRRVAAQAEIIRAKVQREAVMEERQRMAREMHDTLAQSFSGVSFQLEALKGRLPAEATEIREQLELTHRMVQYGHEDFRRSLMNLRGQGLDCGDMAKALTAMADQITAGTGLAVGFEVVGTARELPERVENNLLRIGQECLTNVVRHADAKRVDLQLEFNQDTVRLSVADDGKGFHPGQVEGSGTGHFGLQGVRERAEQIAATADIASKPGEGTIVSITVPAAYE